MCSNSSSGCSHDRRRGSSRLLRSCFGAAINVSCRRRPGRFVRRMGWLRSLLSPLRRLWCHMNAVQRKKRGIYILYDDVKSCPCEDVHVLWSILVESHGLPPPTPMTTPTPTPALRPTRVRRTGQNAAPAPAANKERSSWARGPSEVK